MLASVDSAKALRKAIARNLATRERLRAQRQSVQEGDSQSHSSTTHAMNAPAPGELEHASISEGSSDEGQAQGDPETGAEDCAIAPGGAFQAADVSEPELS